MPFGVIVSINVLKTEGTVVYRDDRDEAAAVANMNGYEVAGDYLKVWRD